MSIEQSIKKFFQAKLDEYAGNAAAAAKSLGVNPVTFWTWVNGKRGNRHESLYAALDIGGCHLVLPGENAKDQSDELATAHDEIRRLKEQNSKLEAQVEVLLKLIGSGNIQVTAEAIKKASG